jgi:GT2 family glycosyltransferase
LPLATHSRVAALLVRTAVFVNMSGLVSVIVPTFDRRNTLREAVESILAQSHRDVEVIVVDDGSTDGTRELMTSGLTDPRVRYRYQANAGVSSARNTGLDLATGDYIAFLDSDDAWKPWHLSLLLAGFERLPEAGMIWTDTEFVDDHGAVVSSSALADLLSAYRYFSLDDLFSSSIALSDLGVDLPFESRDHRLHLGDVFSPMIMGNLVLTSSVVMRRERVEEVGRFDERLSVGEDYEFFLRVCRAGPVAFADVVDTRYRVGTADKLGGPRTSLAMARAYLRVLDATLARDADRITLAPEMILAAQVHAHRWVGEMELLSGSRRMARAHLARALRLRPAQPWTIVLLVLTFVPHRVFLFMVGWRRRMRITLHVAWTHLASLANR